MILRFLYYPSCVLHQTPSLHSPAAILPPDGIVQNTPPFEDVIRDGGFSRRTADLLTILDHVVSKPRHISRSVTLQDDGLDRLILD